jgi:MFS family permease
MKNTAVIGQEVIKWNQLWSLIALDGAIVISWIAYHNYQPRILEQFELTHLSLFLVIAKALVLFIMPPVAGIVADWYRNKQGNRMPVVTIGISITAMIFMVVASVLTGKMPAFLSATVPFFIVLWLISMNIFHSPAISTIELFVPVEKLPLAMAFFTLVDDLVYSIEPIVILLIDFLGAPLTFVTGAVLVSVTGWLLKRNLNDIDVAEEEASHQARPHSNLLAVFGIGLGIGAVQAILMNIFPDKIGEAFSFLNAGENNGRFAVFIILALSAVCSLPLSRLIRGYKLQTIVFSGILIGVVLGLGVLFTTSVPVLSILLCVAFAVNLSLLSISSLPLALSKLSTYNKVLGTGLFFSGVELLNSLLDILQSM